ncbi:FAD-dependent oxidoreductase, partial [Ilumatobacter sp.]|uniref:FAD-dependent oxidoreductase n=1 Tax=Ilumatobacter sp. TaxID=1967498 RepID=UPI003C548F40
MDIDVIVIGGGAAGAAAALQLGRGRRTVVVIDAGEPRNAPAAHMHGYLGHDGRSPAEFLALAHAELAAYDIEVVSDRVVDVVA